MSSDGFSLSALMDEIAAQTSAVVNLHDLSGLTLEIPTLKIRQDQHYHHGSYCAFAKRQGNQAACARNKQRSLERAQLGPFSGYCPYGIWDCAHPVVHEQNVIAVIYVGSLLGERTLAPIRGRNYTGPSVPVAEPQRRVECTTAADYLAKHIIVLVRSWVRLGNGLGKKRDQHYYIQAMHEFISMHYTENISLTDLADQLHVHPNYLGSLISDRTHAHFRNHLVSFRVKRAQVLLRSSDHSITEIAYICGFQDSNYFSTAFKKQVACTPRAYRLAP